MGDNGSEEAEKVPLGKVCGVIVIVFDIGFAMCGAQYSIVRMP